MAVQPVILVPLVELLAPLSPGQRRAVVFSEWVIWFIFLIHFIVTFSLAPSKRGYLRRNWIIVISLLIPYLRIFAIFRAIRAIRVLTTARMITLTNRGIRQLGRCFRQGVSSTSRSVRW